jgi:hypothetical protein
MRLLFWSTSFADGYLGFVEVMQKKQQLIEINEPVNKAIVVARNYT